MQPGVAAVNLAVYIVSPLILRGREDSGAHAPAALRARPKRRGRDCDRALSDCVGILRKRNWNHVYDRLESQRISE
jgi:hypothetical protein